jgi:hypothetical protein
VNSNPSLATAITSQTIDPVTGIGTLVVQLSIEAPLLTSGAMASGATVTPSQVGSINNTFCPNTITTCRQFYTYTLDPGMSCTLDGTYTFVFTLACQASTPSGDCPLGSGSPTTLSIMVSITTGNLCALAEQSVVPTGLLASFETVTTSGSPFVGNNAKTEFFQNQKQNFLLTLASSNGVLFASTSLANVVVLGNDGNNHTVFDSVTLSSGFAGSGWTKAVDATLDNTGTAALAFGFTPTFGLFGGTVARDSPVASIVYATVDLAFVNSRKRGRSVLRLRAIENGRSKPFTTTVSVLPEPVVDATTVALVSSLTAKIIQSSPEPRNGVLLALVLSITAIVICLVAIIAGIAYKRRRSNLDQ